jgi:hypothetical protein
MLRTIAFSLTALFIQASVVWADYTYDQFDGVVRNALDRNGDGMVTQTEYDAFFQGQPAVSFIQSDTSGDGILTGAEFSTLVDDIGVSAAECDVNMDYAFSGTEMTCVEGLLP